MAVLHIAVTKAGQAVDIDTDNIPQEVYEAALAEGLKSFINKGMSKIVLKGLEGDGLAKAKEAALQKGQANLAAILDGTIKLPGKKAANKGVSGAVMTEARRLARNLVKDAMKENGIKISHVEASEITKAANTLLAEDPSLIATAEANLKAREAIPVKINVSAIPISQKKVAAAEKAKAAKKTQLSAKQAGITAKAKPKPGLVGAQH